MSPRQIITRGIVFGLLAAVLCGGGLVMYVKWYGATDRIFPGVTVGHADVGGLRRQEADARLAHEGAAAGSVMAGSTGARTGGPEVARALVQAAELHNESAKLKAGTAAWELDLREAGAILDLPRGLADALSIGRIGSISNRTYTFLRGLIHGHYVPLKVTLRDQVIQRRLTAISQEFGRLPVDATYDFDSDRMNGDVAGQELDVQASLAVVKRALLEGRREIDLVVHPVVASIRADDLLLAKQHVIAQFSTPILAAEAGRLQNVGLAARKISGVVIKPGDSFSFNEVVGPRDAEHGWAQANEIYQGEFVLGYGGGICQVSSTLYNSVLLAGLDVTQRFHHDRPLQYVSPGRDATVAWNLLDFKFRNPMDVPILIGARIVPGTPKQIEVKVYASRPQTNTVRVEESVLRYFPPDMEEIVDPTLPPEVRRVVDEGNYGIEVEVYRVVGNSDQARRELVSHDHYRPKAGKVKVGWRNSPTERKTSQ